MTEVIRHEAGHVAALHALGVEVKSVDRIDRGDGQLGFTAHAACDPVNQAMHIIAAAIAEGDLPRWPLCSGPVVSVDEQHLARLAEQLKWDEFDYHTLIGRARHLMSSPTFKKAYAAVSAALHTTPALDARALSQLLEPTPQRKSATAPVHPTVRAAVLADLKRREWELQDQEARQVLAEFD